MKASLTSRELGRSPRLLVISYNFPPGEQVGGFRWAGLTKYLTRMGWQCEVVTRPWDGDMEVPEEVRVHRARRLPRIRDAYRLLRGVAGTEAEHRPPPPLPEALPHEPGTRATLRNLGGLALSFPDAARGWILNGAWLLRRRIRDFRPDMVVSTGPPHSVHLAAGLAIRGSDVPLWCDFRDPWYPLPFTAPWLQEVYRRLERIALGHAVGAITTTPELAATLQERYPELAVWCLLNAVDRELLSDGRSESRAFSVVHVGTLYGTRDPGVVLEGFADFLEAHPEAVDGGARLELIGAIKFDYPSLHPERIAELGIAEHVSIGGSMPRPQAMELLAEADVALVLAQGQTSQIPAKLYECLALETPALIITEPGSATAGVAANLGGTAVGPNDPDAVSAFLQRVWRGEVEQRERTDHAVDYKGRAAELAKILASRLQMRAEADIDV